MAGISMSALRRALAEFSRDAGRGAGLGFTAGFAPSAYSDLSGPEPGSGFGHSLEQGVEGAVLGAGAGAYGGMGIRSLVRGGRALSGGVSSLREALARAAEERGIGRVAQRGVDDAGDAIRFHGGGGFGEAKASGQRLLRGLQQLKALGEFDQRDIDALGLSPEEMERLMGGYVQPSEGGRMMLSPKVSGYEFDGGNYGMGGPGLNY